MRAFLLQLFGHVLGGIRLDTGLVYAVSWLIGAIRLEMAFVCAVSYLLEFICLDAGLVFVLRLFLASCKIS